MRLLCLFAVFLLIGPFYSYASSGGGHGAGQEESAGQDPFPPHDGIPKTYIVKVGNNYKAIERYFDPEVLKIQSGDTVTWINQNTGLHNIVVYPDRYPEGAEGFASPNLKHTNDQWSHTFTHEGTYEYHCTYHEDLGQRGTIHVGKISSEEEFHVPTAEELKAYRELVLGNYPRDTIEEIEFFKRAQDKAKAAVGYVESPEEGEQEGAGSGGGH